MSPPEQLSEVPAGTGRAPAEPINAYVGAAGLPAPVNDAVLAELVDDLGDREMVLELVTDYLAEADQHLRGLHAAAAAGNHAAVVSVAHTLRSTSDLLGAQRLASMLGDVERLAHLGTGELAARLAEVDVELARAAAHFASVVRRAAHEPDRMSGNA